MGKTIDYILPDLGEGLHEVEVISWKVKEGDTVTEMQTLAEVETDKALAELPSPYAGRIARLHAKVGEIAHVGHPIVTFENATQNGKAVTDGSAAAAPGAEAPKAAHVQTGPSAPPSAFSGAEAATDAGTVVGSMEGVPTLGGDGKVAATPAVRKLAKDLNVDIARIRGTGRGGRVTAADVERAAKAGPSPAGRTGNGTLEHGATPSPTSASLPRTAETFAPVKVDSAGVSQRIPFRGVRRKIADALSQSIRTAVHFTVMDAADVSKLDRLRRQQQSASGEKISFLPFIVQAACRALKHFPQLNANVDDANAEILIKGVINMGIAVDTEHGLMVPVISGADRMAILPLGRRIGELAEKCKGRTIAREELAGGTFTISNVGSYGGAFATPIINYPEVAILAVGRAREAVMARNGGIFVGQQMPLSLSCDHRVVDGAYGAKLLNQIVQYLENPDVLLEPAGR